MAKEAKTKKAPSKVTVRLLAQSLVAVKFYAEAEDETEKVQLRYHALIDSPERFKDNTFFFRCTFSVTKKKVEAEDGASVEATYGCIIQHPSNDLSKVEEAAKEYAATSTWNAFGSLFAVITHQMRTTFPPLPPSPGGIASSGRSSFDEVDPFDEVDDESETG